MDPVFDEITLPFRLPEFWCGELCCSFCRPKTDADRRAIFEYISSVARGTVESVAARGVRALAMNGCVAGGVPPEVVRDFLSATPLFRSLVVLRMNNCGLEGEASRLLLACVAATHQANSEHAQMQLWLDGNGVSTSTLRHLSDVLCSHRKLRGVSTLSLNGNPVDDEGLSCVADVFPSLAALHLSGTDVRGRDLRVALRDLPKLTLLGLDRNALRSDAANDLLCEIATRGRMCHPRRLEVWLRGSTEYEESWCDLLAFVARPKRVCFFTLKHDLLATFGSRPRQSSAVHDRVDVHLHIGGLRAVPVHHRRVLGTKTLYQLAQEAINELNLVCMGDDADICVRSLMERRLVYRAELSALSGFLAGKMYRLGVFQLARVDPYSGERTTFPCAPGSLLGRPTARGGLLLLVEAEECSRR